MIAAGEDTIHITDYMTQELDGVAGVKQTRLAESVTKVLPRLVLGG